MFGEEQQPRVRVNAETVGQPGVEVGVHRCEHAVKAALDGLVDGLFKLGREHNAGFAPRGIKVHQQILTSRNPTF